MTSTAPDITTFELQWGHAYSGVETRRPHGTVQTTMRNSKLQWGHAYSGVETRRPHHGQFCAILASMGPRLFRRGNAKWGAVVDGRAALQWGHAYSGVETALSPRITPRHVCFVSIVHCISPVSTSWRVLFHPHRGHPGPDSIRKLRELHTCGRHYRSVRNWVRATLAIRPEFTMKLGTAPGISLPERRRRGDAIETAQAQYGTDRWIQL